MDASGVIATGSLDLSGSLVTDRSGEGSPATTEASSSSHRGQSPEAREASAVVRTRDGGDLALHHGWELIGCAG